MRPKAHYNGIQKNKPHHRSRSNIYWAWQAGKRKVIWCFEPVKEMGGQMTGQKKRRRTSAALFVHCPLLITVSAH